MSIDPDKAIEKLAEYRKDSQEKKDTAEGKKKHISPITNSIRNFLIKFHWFNAAYLSGLAVFTLLAMIFSDGGAIWWFFLLILNFILARQIFVVIHRLSVSEGRHTLFDDVFVMLLIVVTFFELFSTWGEILGTFLFSTFHIVLFILWIAQIFFINYRKPDVDYVPPVKEEDVELVYKSFKERIIEFFTLQRSITTLIGVGIGIVLSIPFF